MRRAKRILALALVCALALSCAACGRTEGNYRVLKTLSTASFRIGFRQGDATAGYVTAALKTLAADGTVQSLARSWFGSDEVALEADAAALDALGSVPQRTFIMGLRETGFPMSYAEGDGYTGFDVELAQAVCDRLGWTLRCQPISEANAYVELSSGNVDCVWGGMSLADVNLDADGEEKPEEEQIACTEPYLENSIVLVSRVGGVSTVGGLKNGTVLLDTGDCYMAALQANARVLSRIGRVERITGGAAQCFAALDAGSCTAIVTDSVALAYYTK